MKSCFIRLVDMDKKYKETVFELKREGGVVWGLRCYV